MRAWIAVACVLLALGCSSPAVPSDGGGTGSSISLVIDETHLYWLDGIGNLVRAEKTGGEPSILASETATYGNYQFLTADDPYVLWRSPEDTVVRRVPKAGGPSEPMGAGLGLAAAGGRAYFLRLGTTGDRNELMEVDLATRAERVIETGGFYHGIAVGGEELFGSSCFDGLWRLPVAGGPRTPLVEDTCLLTIALDDTHVYYGEGGADPPIMRVPRAGGPAERVTDGSLVFAVRGGFLYTVRDGQVVEVPVEGGEPTPLAAAVPASSNVPGVAVDAERVYWTEPVEGGRLVLRSVPR